MAHDLGVWETIAECDWHGHVVAVLVNTSEKDKQFRTGEMVGFFDPVDRKDIVADYDIEALFDSFASEPKEKGGEYVPPKMTIEEKDFLTSKVNIAAPSEWKAKYMDIIVAFHDVCSKGKFDLGRTDVIEHKVSMKTEEPIHIRQFRIPLEHRQTIYDWVDFFFLSRAPTKWARGAKSCYRLGFSQPFVPV